MAYDKDVNKGEIEWVSIDDEEKVDDEEVHDDDEVHVEETDDVEEINDDEDEVTDDEKKQDDDKSIDIEETDDESTKSDNDDQEMADAKKTDGEKAEEEKFDEEQKGNEQAMDEHTKDDQIGDLVSVTHKEKPDLLLSTSSHSLSSNYGNQFLNNSSDISLVGIIQEPADTEINSVMDVPVHQELPPVSQNPLLDVLFLKGCQNWKINWKQCLRRIQLSLLNLLSLLLNPLSAAKSLSELELKKILFDKMDKSRSNMTHEKHQELYDALLNSIMLDEAIVIGDVNPDKVLRKRDHGDDQDPTSGSD
ncbi:hypothetical protein Tco_0575847 [Tanacetum coccineum]